MRRAVRMIGAVAIAWYGAVSIRFALQENEVRRPRELENTVWLPVDHLDSTFNGRVLGRIEFGKREVVAHHSCNYSHGEYRGPMTDLKFFNVFTTAMSCAESFRPNGAGALVGWPSPKVTFNDDTMTITSVDDVFRYRKADCVLGEKECFDEAQRLSGRRS
jgi:hypothetical protein